MQSVSFILSFVGNKLAEASSMQPGSDVVQLAIVQNWALKVGSGCLRGSSPYANRSMAQTFLFSELANLVCSNIVAIFIIRRSARSLNELLETEEALLVLDNTNISDNSPKQSEDDKRDSFTACLKLQKQQ